MGIPCYCKNNPMHIPDGFLSTPVWLTMNAISVPAVGVLARRANSHLDDSRIPLLGVMGAFVFAAQMINFPVGAGTSGHLVGGALLACTLGPAAATVVMTAILAVQALVFQDGGVLSLGANVFNMAVLGVLAGYLPYHFWGAGRLRKLSFFAGGVLSVLVSAALTVSQLLISGIPMRTGVLAISAGLFLISALIEGLITVAVMGALEKLNPNWIHKPMSEGRLGMGLLVSAAVLLAGVGVVVASAAPDGLESLAEQIGLADKATVLFSTPLADYEANFLNSDWFRKAAAGMAGLMLIFGVCILCGRMISRRGSA